MIINDFPDQEFKEICLIPSLEDFTGYYISDKGVLWSTKTNKRRKTRVRIGNGLGYEVITLSALNGGYKRNFSVHRLVALAFKYNSAHHELTVNHIDENPLNNVADNLEWMTIEENIRYSQAGRCRAGDPDMLAKEFNQSGITLVDFAKQKGVPMNTMWDIINKISTIENTKKMKVFSKEEKLKILDYLKTHSGVQTATKFNCSQSMISKIKKEFSGCCDVCSTFLSTSDA